MFADILVALTIALCFELFGCMGKTMKHILYVVSCLTLIVAYFCNGTTINFLGTMDFGIWVLFVIVFSTILSFVERRLMRFLKSKGATNQ